MSSVSLLKNSLKKEFLAMTRERYILGDDFLQK